MEEPQRERPRMKAPNEPHLACILLLDTSESMSGSKISSLNNAVNMFKEKTMLDDMAKKRIDIAIVTFDDTVEVVQDFTPISEMKPVELNAGGRTAMCKAIDTAIDMVKSRNKVYNSMGTPCFKPWIFMITDGQPTDDMGDNLQKVAARIKEEQTKGSHGRLKFFALGVSGYNKEILKTLTDKTMELTDFDFTGIFDWLSKSMTTISVSQVDQGVQLPTLPDNARVIPSDWGE